MRHDTDAPVESLAANATRANLVGAPCVQLALAGLGCVNCVNRVRNALLRTPGVLDVEMVLPDASVACVWHEPGVSVKDLVGAVVAASEGTQHRFTAVPIRSRF